jgi:NAD(P)-dependent dehydrogenase (short-subunit alcohol dehydrogenase family)
VKPEFANYPSLRGKNVLITGGGSGIGAEMVRQFTKQKANVWFIDRNRTVSQLIEAETGATFIELDLTDTAELTRIIELYAAQNNGFDVLINNAARDDRHDWRSIDGGYWDERFSTNLKHQFFCIQAIAPGMIEKHGGSIVNIGSNSWWEAGAGFPAYATAKSGVHGLTRTMARELGEFNIRVNTIVPGWIMTDRQKELWVTKEALEKQLDRQCLGVEIEPVYVARMAVFLASDDASMCTASNFMVDGGSI